MSEHHPPKPSAGAWGVSLRVLLSLLVGAILATTAAVSIGFKDGASQALRTEVALSQSSLYVNSYRYYGQSFADGAQLRPAKLALQASLAGTARRLVKQLATDTASGQRLVPLNDRLERLMTTEVRLARAHRLGAARALDATAVTPVFNGLVSLMAADVPRLDRQAAAASADASSGILASVLGAGALLLLVLAFYERARRRRLQSLAEAVVLERSRARFAALVRNATDLLVVVGADGVVTFETPSAAAMLGLGVEGLLGRDLAQVVHPEDRPILQELCQDADNGCAELRLQRADGSARCFELHATCLLDHPDIRGVVLNGRDVTEQKQLEAKLRHQALHDPLTGLANRTLFGDRVEHALAGHGRTGDELAVLLVDLDDFKSVNDVFGHGTGDELLVEVAARLGRQVRRGDTVARLGGDEFGILLDAPLAPGEAGQVAERIRETLAAPVQLSSGAQTVRASIGIARALQAETAEELVRDADLAMYVAKQQGKGCAVVFEEDMHRQAQGRLALASELRVALEAGDRLTGHYRPVVSARQLDEPSAP